MIKFKDFQQIEDYRKSIGITQKKAFQIIGVSETMYYFYRTGHTKVKPMILEHANYKLNQFIKKTMKGVK